MHFAIDLKDITRQMEEGTITTSWAQTQAKMEEATVQAIIIIEKETKMEAKEAKKRKSLEGWEAKKRQAKEKT